jgi:hypothetical protein
VQELRYAALARRVQHDFCAPTVDGMKVALVSRPHARQRRKVVNLGYAIECLVHERRIKYRAYDIFGAWARACRMANIQDSHLTASIEQSRDQMLSDESGTSSNKRLCYQVSPTCAAAVISILDNFSYVRWCAILSRL